MKPRQKMTISYRSKRRGRRGVKISTPFAGKIDHAVEGAALADRLYNDAPGGTVDCMLLRILGRMAAEPPHVTSEACRQKLRALQTELVAR
jgi:hypothetical protein